MAYLTYTDYQDMGGALPEAAFDRFEFTAEKHIDRLTHGRVVNETPVRVAVKNLAFEVVEYLSIAEGGGAAVATASNDGISVTYVSQRDQRVRILEIAKDYLDQEETDDGVPLMYAGVDG